MNAIPVTLSQLNDYLRRVIEQNFAYPLWVIFEIHHVSHSRGHYFLECVERDATTDEIVATMDAVVWYTTAQKLIEEHGALVDELLRSGLKVCALCQVDYHPRWGLKLKILDIDPGYTLGEMELQRRAVLARLEREGLMERNRQVPLPPIIKRIAVISSPKAAGLQDFYVQLRDNPYGYTFRVHLYEASVQGDRAVYEIVHQLERIPTEQYDVVAIVRGGGARLDLTVFDAYEIARAIALCPIPVVTGIGHERDRSVADMVAHTALKTPTALAEWIVAHNARFESTLVELAGRIQRMAAWHVQRERQVIEQYAQQLRYAAERTISHQYYRLTQARDHFAHQSRRLIEVQRQRIESAEHLLRSLDPRRILRRGYSMTIKEGKLVKSVRSLQAGDAITTRWIDGAAQSQILHIDETGE